MSNNIKLLFFLNTHKANSEGLSPLILRITYNRKIKQISTGFYIGQDRWDSKAKKMRGSKPDALQVNHYILVTNAKLMEIFNKQLQDGDINLDNLVDTFFGKNDNHVSLLYAIKHHNENFKSRIGIDYTFSTYEKYDVTRKKIEAFLNHLGKKDIRLKDLTLKFIADFELFLKTVEHNQHNTAVKYCKNLKKILNVSVINNWVETNPFNSYTCVYKETDCIYLLPHEINLIEEKQFKLERLQVVKDLFLFQCYTGLAYVDMSKLTKANIMVGIDRNKWIIISRTKTGTKSTIPLLTQAVQILEKYDGVCKGEKLLPVYSIQKFNSYLDEIADLCGINKKISSHVGRRTFGNLALSSGISLNVIAKILGHSNTITTQKIYAVTNDQLVSKEFDALRRSVEK